MFLSIRILCVERVLIVICNCNVEMNHKMIQAIFIRFPGFIKIHVSLINNPSPKSAR